MNAVSQTVMGGGVVVARGGRPFLGLAGVWSRKVLAKPPFQPVNKRSLATVQSGTTSRYGSKAGPPLLYDTNSRGLDPVWSVNSRLSPLLETASYYAGKNLNQIKVATAVPQVIELPSLDDRTKPAVESPPPAGAVTWITNPLHRQVEISEPAVDRAPVHVPTPVGPTLHCVKSGRQHRMLKVRKKKMKVHRRKRLWKRMWTVWKKKFYGRERKREIEFRTRLIEAVREAQKFDAENYVKSYIKDYHYEFVPKTYGGMKKHPATIQELFEKDKQDAIRKKLDQTNLKTGGELILPGETVEDFVKRNN